MYEPKHLHRWTMPECYFGEEWPEYFSSGFGQSRDSDCLERSNFEIALAKLGGETDTVIVVRERHWAVGWVEWIAIHQDDELALVTGDELRERCEDYPVLDDEHLSNLEAEEANDVWHQCYSDAERLAYIRTNRDQFDFCDYADLLGCVRGRYFVGYASELIY